MKVNYIFYFNVQIYLNMCYIIYNSIDDKIKLNTQL